AEVGNSLWAVHTVDLSGRAALRWYEFDETTSALKQTGLITDPLLEFSHPTIGANEFGDVVIAFNGSSVTQRVIAYAVYGATANGVTSFQAPVLLKQGEADYPGLNSPWGGYSAITLDPTDHRIFWAVQKYAKAGAANNWGTQITQLIVSDTM